MLWSWAYFLGGKRSLMKLCIWAITIVGMYNLWCSYVIKGLALVSLEFWKLFNTRHLLEYDTDLTFLLSLEHVLFTMIIIYLVGETSLWELLEPYGPMEIVRNNIKFQFSYLFPLFLQTVVVWLEGEEIHLVPMLIRKDLTDCSYFWGFSVMLGLNNSCLAMPNLRCLGSCVWSWWDTYCCQYQWSSFKDWTDGLQWKINNEMDQEQTTEMLSELKYYHDDKAILKQYIEKWSSSW